VVPVDGPAVPVVGCGVCAGGQGLVETGCAVTHAVVAVPADGVGEFDEAAVLFSDLKADQSPRPRARPVHRNEVLRLTGLADAARGTPW
jgi:hypothetical protein